MRKKIFRLCLVVAFSVLCVAGIIKFYANQFTDNNTEITASYPNATIQFISKYQAQSKMQENTNYIVGTISEVTYPGGDDTVFKINNKYYRINNTTDYTDEIFIGHNALIIDVTADTQNPTAIVYIY